MKYSIYINQSKALQWDLNLTEASIFAFCYELPSWANSVSINGVTWYQYSKTKIIDEYPLLTNKPDTIYRTLKKLESKGLICLTKVMNIDHLLITQKGREWNNVDNPNLGKKSETSEKNPNDLGKKSESTSEKNPTYNITNSNNNTNDTPVVETTGSLFPETPKKKKKPTTTLFCNSIYKKLEDFKSKFNGDEYKQIDLNYYFQAVSDWSDSSNKKRTANGWIATARNFMRNDKEKGKLKLILSDHDKDNNDALDYLNGFN